MSKPNCYECKYRGSIPGDAHSKCCHPRLKEVNADPMAELLSMLGGKLPIGPSIDAGLNIKGNQHGINSGWFNWPFNFDPVWLENCDGFERKLQKNDSTSDSQ